MIKNSTDITLCPVCYGINTLVGLSDIVNNPSDFIADHFCKTCGHAKASKYFQGHLRKDLDSRALSKAVVNPMRVMTSTLIPMGVCLTCDEEAYGRAFAGKIGAAADRFTVIIPAYNCWGGFLGPMRVSRYKCVMPGRKRWAGAGLLSDEYSPKRLFVCENPAVALMIRYASALLFSKPVSVMVPIPGRTPPLEALQDPVLIRALVNTEGMLKELLDILPEDAILTMGDPLAPEQAGRLIRTAFSGGKRVKEWKTL